MKNKKIIFFDGDGTLWYPKETKRSKKPHWIYEDEKTKDNYLEYLELTPSISDLLVELKNRKIILAVISANPKEREIAIKEIKDRINYFHLEDYFDIVESSAGDNPDGKGLIILDVLEKLSLQKEDALMIGDSFKYDYEGVKKVDIDAVWIKNSVSKLPEIMPGDIVFVDETYELLNILK